MKQYFKENAIKRARQASKISRTANRLSRYVSRKLLTFNNILLKDENYYLARKITKPLHWLWIWKWLDNIKRNAINDPFLKPGVYLITGEPGAGKSSLAFEIMTRDLRRLGKGSYINTAIEVPQYDQLKNKYYINHARYEITDFFNEGKIELYPNQYQFAALHIDEAHKIWQYRQNNTREYMDTFKPFMDYAVGVRHYIGRIFAYTQMDKTDTQLMSLCRENIVSVEKHIGFDYERWLDTGKFELTILGWDLTFKKAVSTSSGTWTIKDTHKAYYKRTFDMDLFDTFNLRDDLKTVRFDNRYNIKGVKNAG